jgi:hypothetical protein
MLPLLLHLFSAVLLALLLWPSTRHLRLTALLALLQLLARVFLIVKVAATATAATRGKERGWTPNSAVGHADAVQCRPFEALTLVRTHLFPALLLLRISIISKRERDGGKQKSGKK